MGKNERAALKPLSRRWTWLSVGVSVIACGALVWALWGSSTADHRAAFEVGWKVGAAGLAILAAVLGARRVELGEREHLRQMATDEANRTHAEALLRRQLDADEAVRADAIARQITDLSAKASEQLGSDKAAMRIGGLTDLERLAESHPELRQTVVDRICAYLREPFAPPARDSQDVEALLQLDVRSTAQEILRRHLCAPKDSPKFWDGISIDLRYASLVDFNFYGARCTSANFEGARFTGVAIFSSARMANVDFERAQFSARAHFTDFKVAEIATFSSVVFDAKVHFFRAAIGVAEFDRAEFGDVAAFGDARFGRSDFSGARFAQETTFAGSTLSDANFVPSTTAGYASAVIRGTSMAMFENATFEGAFSAYSISSDEDVDFSGCRFLAPVYISDPVDPEGGSHRYSVTGARIKADQVADSDFPTSWYLTADPDDPSLRRIELRDF
ncbi:pentapeptide repeat-containing protein [Amycolatopsis sp. CA-230715]|uniref:pentapeptide repeat-containing protein n=1 Tax=Amycolatopsis sp. CA-230715 TaxID=2745196 RepID=UPI001C00C7E7|nr:pentapeptide repeat-containing protein [Amycolatopsis sp. CA-230715]QWF81557.1 hypothetical protein HUW46_04990 [Amycolatopsis sp. CA-230715]